ncbi:peroxisomal biogenesis factor 19, partial [Exaiptasia diaphana]|uniref:Peroxin-19 n=1 Tax=Exaiptasia diaphana TaxID=2652724 RepID=A0A913WP80_EXADI
MADDDELDELLDSALSDFDKPATPSVKKIDKQCQKQDETSGTKDTNTESLEDKTAEPSEDELSKIFAASFAEAASDLEEAMKKMGGAQDPEFMTQLTQLADSAQQAASKGSFSILIDAIDPTIPWEPE